MDSSFDLSTRCPQLVTKLARECSILHLNNRSYSHILQRVLNSRVYQREHSDAGVKYGLGDQRSNTE